MKSVIVIARAGFGIVGAALLALGIALWTGHARGLVGLHMGLGFLFVVLLWVLAILGARAGAPRGLVITALLWGVLIPLLGYAQLGLLPGSHHWTIRVMHLLVGVAGMGMGGALSARLIGGRRAAAAPHVSAPADGAQ